MGDERYVVTLIGGGVRKVRERNLHLVCRYIQPSQMLSEQRRPFTWRHILDQTGSCEGNGKLRSWSQRLDMFDSLGLPVPLVVPAAAVCSSIGSLAAAAI